MTRAQLEEEEEEERRDWANLIPDLIDEISGRLLSSDVTEYLRFRAVCKPWREGTDDPHAQAMDTRFRPRNWIVLCITPDPTPRRRRILNLATGASLAVDLPALSTHCYLCAADGLLVLYHRPTDAIRLLDPLSNVVTDFPAISCSKILQVCIGTPLASCQTPSTALAWMSNIVFAKPGDAMWKLVSPGQASHWLFDYLGKVAFQSLVSFGGRCYFSSPKGSVYVLRLQPLPRLVDIAGKRLVPLSSLGGHVPVYCPRRGIYGLSSEAHSP
ncbi:hypothetical protein HU200_030970 [Digitaria exilis]|uniref:KIB1-4 beta-propeller domain-containing protein n=1 Tax=Digitaria exilis TaxID=1010633 RepID=A0A835BW94_9POAL|nr:hypothetical protein HU200_030970 [Digitaria exilis]